VQRRLAVGCLLAGSLITASCAARAQDPAVPAARGVPDGAVISRIVILVDDVFDLDDPREDRALYRLANALHRRTSEEAIRAQLLFATGEGFSARKLAETERTLRANGYLAAAVVRPTAVHGGDVEIEVKVRDVWSLTPAVDFRRQGGRNKAAVSLEDPNFLGSGKGFKFEHGRDFDRTTTGLEVVDPNLFGSRWRLGLGYFDNSDGHSRELAFGRPFFDFDTAWSAAFAFLADVREVPRYSLGHEVDRVTLERDSLRLEGGFSSGYENGWIRRWLFGVTRDDREFSAPADGSALVGEAPVDRHFLYPWVGWELIEDEYARTQNLNQIGRVEDLYLGSSVRVELGFSPARFGTPATTLFAARARTSRCWDGDQRVLLLGADGAGRWSAGGLDATLVNASAEFFQRNGERRLWYARLGGSFGKDLDVESQLLLGGDTGLRGYPLRFQGGTASALLTLEHRYFTDWYPLRLARVGAAAFFDVGRTWGHDPVAGSNLGWLKDVGVGLRLGNARSSHGSVIHLDVAFPLDAPPDVDSVQFLIQTRKSF